MNPGGNPLEVSGITSDSKAILELFLEHYKFTSAITFVIAIRRMTEINNKMDFTQLNYDDYTFIKDNISSQQFTLLTSFFKYLYANNFLNDESRFNSGICYWSKEVILNDFIKQKEKKDKKKTKKEFTASLTLAQIDKLKTFEQNCLEEDSPAYDMIRMAFCFHAIFYDEMNPKILKDIKMSDFVDGEIMTVDGVYDVPPEYWDMFLYYKSRTYSGFSTSNTMVDKLGKIVGITNLVPSNFTAARKQNLWVCGECGNEYLNFSENWQSINGKFVCNSCAEKILSEDIKKNLIIDEIKNTEIDLISEKEHKKIEHHTSNFEKLRGKLKPPCDFDSWNVYLEEIGNLGQKYVVEQEKSKLVGAGLDDLAEQVTDDPANDHTNGYDVLSFTANKKELHIEVKATPGSFDQPFYLTENERQTAIQEWSSSDNYEIHRVYNIQSGDVGLIIYKNFDDFNFENLVYKI